MAIYQDNLEQYKKTVNDNLEKYPLFKHHFGKLILEKNLSIRTIKELADNQFLLSLALSIPLKNFETLIEGSKKIKSSDRFFRELKKCFYEPKFYHILAQLYAAEKLLSKINFRGIKKSDTIEVEFAPAGNQGFDLIYKLNDVQFYAEVKNYG